MSLTLPLADARATDPTLAGSKAARLAALHRAGSGLRIPDGFVVTTEAFGRALAALPAGERSAAAVAAESLPDELDSAIESAVQLLGDDALAVRSSCTDEDLAGASFAGLYETYLDVRGAAAVKEAVRKCFASAFGERVRAYRGAATAPKMAVLVQRLVRPDAAGVAFTADPVTGRRDVTLVSATRGLGEALVSGTTSGEEWEVAHDGAPALRRRSEPLLEEDAVRRIASLARELAEHAGTPQDVEWALAGSELFLLQARPMTALPEEVRWDAPPGAWVRNFRLGEWIGDPVTPLFESWLLRRLEERTHAELGRLFGMRVENAHALVNGWYFYRLYDFPKGLALVRFFFVSLWSLLTRFHQVVSVIPPLAHLGFSRELERWRRDLLPAYQSAVESARAQVEDVATEELPALVDDLADAAGDQFTSILGVAGYAAKAELPLALFWKENLATVDGSYLDLVRGDAPRAPAAHHVTGLDWFFPTLGELGELERAAPDPERLRAAKSRSGRVLESARAALATTPAQLARFEKLLAEAQRAHRARQEQTCNFTLAWPVLRRAALRIGEALVARGVLQSAGDVFFLNHAEALDALREEPPTSRAATIATRKHTWERQRRLTPPLLLGELFGPFKEAFAQIDSILASPDGDVPGALRGMPGSPGRVSGPVRILRSMEELSRLKAGEILVSPVTTPGWTPAFARALAVVTDTGSIVSHASIVAREYGIPAVVATACATRVFHDGQIVTVDGARGVVFPVS